QHALAAVPLPAVAEFESLVFAGRGTRGNRCPAHVSRDEFNLRLDGGIAPAVEDLPGTNVDDLQHLAAPWKNGGQHSDRAPARQASVGWSRREKKVADVARRGGKYDLGRGGP